MNCYLITNLISNLEKARLEHYVATKFINNELDNNQKVLVVFLDLTKAFDTVDHKKLINMFPGLGIKNKLLDWFISNLNDRKQKSSINGILSFEKKNIWGNTMYCFRANIIHNIYINDICNIGIDNHIVILFYLCR